jgi:hypothetical protein
MLEEFGGFFSSTSNFYGYKWTWANKNSANKSIKTIILDEIVCNIKFFFANFLTLSLPTHDNENQRRDLD